MILEINFLPATISTFGMFLIEENSSVWSMIDEIKSSEIEAHASSLKKELDKKILDTLSLIGTKIAQA